MQILDLINMLNHIIIVCMSANKYLRTEAEIPLYAHLI